MTTEVYHAEAIAHHYRPGVRPESGYFQIPCPAHGGTDNNLHLADAQDGGLILRCWSTGCTFNQVLAAFQEDGLAVNRAWTYPNGKVVNRIDRAGSKDIKSPGTTKGVALLITNDSPDALIVITEGESDRDAVLSAGLRNVAAGCFVGGAKVAGDADYSVVKGRRVAIWPDNDEEGKAALLAVALACEKAGAAHVYAVKYVGDPESKQGAADLNADGIALHLREDQLREESAQSFRLVWVDLAESTRDLPPTEWLVPGLITVGESTLLVGAPKSGKTLFILDLLRAITQTGKFLGLDVPLGPAWILSELTPRTLKGQMRLLNFEPDEGTSAAFLTQQNLADMTPQGVIDDIRRKFEIALREDRKPALVILDTMGRWLSGQYLDYNGYGDMSAATLAILTLAADLGQHDTATLVSHHSNKSHKPGAEGALGSQALGGTFDNVINLRIQKKLYGPREISIQARNDTSDIFKRSPLVQLILPEGEMRLIQHLDEDDVDDRVLQAVEEGADTRQAVETSTGEAKKTVTDSLKRLKDGGDINVSGGGKATRYQACGSNRPL